MRLGRKFYIGIDQGTTGTTCLLLNEDWNVAAETHLEHRQYYPKPGWVEHDPEELVSCVREAAESAMRAAGVNASEVVCAGIDNQGETVVAWDRETGAPVCPAIVWQDRRTSSFTEELPPRMVSAIRELTGLQPDAYFGATKLRWILDNVPEARTLLGEGRLMAGPSDSWFLWKLTGGRVFATDVSTASRTMLFNIHTMQWDQGLLDYFGIPRGILPEVRNSAEIYGSAVFTGADGVPAEIPLSANLVDQEAALFGQACLSEGMVKTTYGTGCFMVMHTGTRPVFSGAGLLTSIAWKLRDRPAKFELDGGIYAAGSVITWMKDHLKILESAKETDALCGSVEDTAGVVFVPALTGLAAPWWDAFARGMIIGITPGTERAHIVRAAMESIAYQVKDILDQMERDSGIRVRAMRADGGITNSSFMMQFQADILGIPVDVPVISETTALGTAYMAAYGAGEFTDLSEIEANWKLKKRYEPRMSAEERKERMQRWHDAVGRCRGWALNEEGGLKENAPEGAE